MHLKLLVLFQVASHCFGARSNSGEKPPNEVCSIAIPDAENPKFRFCDPDHIYTDEQSLQNLHNHIKKCIKESEFKGIIWQDLQAVLVLVKSFHVQENNLNETLTIAFKEKKIDWLELKKKASILAIYDNEKSEISSWLTPKFLEESLDSVQNMSSRLSSVSRNSLDNILVVSANSMCHLVHDAFIKKHIQQATVLWICLGLLMFFGGLIFIIWIYRFFKNHPTEEDSSLNDMSDTLCDAQNNDSKANVGYTLSNGQIDVVSHLPSKSPTQIEHF